MNLLDGETVLAHTIKRVIAYANGIVFIAAPQFDKGGRIDEVALGFGKQNVRVHYSHDASPLSRLISVSDDLKESDYICRIDGFHLFVDLEKSAEMAAFSAERQLDCVKFPDDFPVQFTSDIYRVGALRKLSSLLSSSFAAIYEVHPKFFMFRNSNEFRCSYLPSPPKYSDKELSRCREIARSFHSDGRIEVTGRSIAHGDQITFHYELALLHLNSDMNVLDVACGDGFGARIISRKVQRVQGVDYDSDVIALAVKLSVGYKNCEFTVGNVIQLNFPDAHFDAITFMETIEHVDDRACLAELHRVLKSGGKLILSTPQNSQGHIPLTFAHLREYSLTDLVQLCSEFFQVDHTIGIKQGRITFNDDPIGTNTVLVCTKC